uniref:Uncharacterized protein n=1 Tax=Heterorhabditis bacteriophora TaxID=37862 RepID=A0A1I7W9A5_HETBA
MHEFIITSLQPRTVSVLARSQSIFLY